MSRLRSFPTIVVALIALFTAAAYSRPITAALATPPEEAEQTDVKGLVIALFPTGFVPAAVEAMDGRYLFIVQNHSGIRDLTFRLDRQTGDRLHEVHDQKLQWKKRFDLHPGTYVLSVVDHPTWHCLITIRPR